METMTQTDIDAGLFDTLEECLNDLYLNGFQDEESGQQEYGTWYALFRFTDAETNHPLIPEGAIGAILHVDSQGFKYSFTFDTEEALTEAWQICLDADTDTDTDTDDEEEECEHDWFYRQAHFTGEPCRDCTKCGITETYWETEED